MDIPAHLLIHQVVVETQSGEGAYGDVYASVHTSPAFVDYNRQLVRDRGGAEVVSEATLYTLLSEQPYFLPDSRVTLPDGTITFVLKAKPQDSGDLGAPNHLEVTLK